VKISSRFKSTIGFLNWIYATKHKNTVTVCSSRIIFRHFYTGNQNDCSGHSR